MAPPPMTTAVDGSGSGGDDDRVAGDGDLARLAALDGDLVAGVQAAVAVEHRHLAALEQLAEPADQAVDHLLLALDGAGPVDADLAHLEAELGGALDRAVHVGALEELLGRDAADVQAGAAQLVLLDEGDAQPGRGPVERRRVAARAAADDHDVEVLLLAVDLAAAVALHRRGDVVRLRGLLGLDRRSRLGGRRLVDLGCHVRLGPGLLLGAAAAGVGRRRGALVADAGQDRADLDGVALAHQDLGDRAADRGRDLGVDLVGGDLEERFVLGDRVADLLEPAGDRSLGDGLTELGHGYVGHRLEP
jgi:hypothetical protein